MGQYIKQIKSKTLSLIISDGEHWLCIANMREKYVDFLCSYNSNPQKYLHIWQRLLQCKKKIFRFSFQLQSEPYSTSCGAWVIFFCYCLSRNFTGPEIVSQFFARARSSSRHHALGESAYKRDLFVSFLIPHLFPSMKNRLIPEKTLFNLDFYKSQKKNEH